MVDLIEYLENKYGEKRITRKVRNKDEYHSYISIVYDLGEHPYIHRLLWITAYDDYEIIFSYEPNDSCAGFGFDITKKYKVPEVALKSKWHLSRWYTSTKREFMEKVEKHRNSIKETELDGVFYEV